MRIAPAPTLRPPKARAVEVACAPDAPADAATLPGFSFARVLGGATGPDAIREELRRLEADGALVRDAAPKMFVYRAAHAGRKWMGLACAIDTRDLVAHLDGVAADEEIQAARMDLERVGAQLVPTLVRVEASTDVAYLMACDTNERPGYHFVAADGSTHSAWEVKHPQAYEAAFADLDPMDIRAGGAQAMAAHLGGSMPWAILTSDDDAQASGPLAPRCGLFVLLTGA